MSDRAIDYYDALRETEERLAAQRAAFEQAIDMAEALQAVRGRQNEPEQGRWPDDPGAPQQAAQDPASQATPQLQAEDEPERRGYGALHDMESYNPHFEDAQAASLGPQGPEQTDASEPLPPPQVQEPVQNQGVPEHERDAAAPPQAIRDEDGQQRDPPLNLFDQLDVVRQAIRNEDAQQQDPQLNLFDQLDVRRDASGIQGEPAPEPEAAARTTAAPEPERNDPGFGIPDFDEGQFTYFDQQRISEIAESAQRILETETGGRMASELRMLYGDTENMLWDMFRTSFPEGKDLDFDDFQNFQDFADRAMNAILEPELYLRRDREQALDDGSATTVAPGERSDRVAEASGSNADREHARSAAEAWEARMPDVGRAMRDDAERSLGMGGPSLGM